MGADIGCPGIYPMQDKTLTITGNGSLEALGNYAAPGIGSGPTHKGYDYAGDIVIKGGTIIAKGGMDALGIGTYDNECGKIIIRSTARSVKAVRGSRASKDAIGVVAVSIIMSSARTALRMNVIVCFI